MRIPRRTRRTLGTWLAISAAGTLIGAGYAYLSRNDAELGALIGFTICASLVGLELFVVRQPLGAALRRMKLPYFLALTTAVWTALIALSLDALPDLVARYDEPHPRGRLHDLAFSFALALAVNFGLRVRSLVGPRVLANFLLGRYHRPLREERVFMFLDIADSSSLAERLGDEQVQALIGRFFFDIARPIAEHRGETHRYIGDEVVVTWPLRTAVEEARCLGCIFAIQELLARRGAWYQARFGTVPRFRIGLHGGPVVVSEVGDDKREIVYFGDTVNTAARLQELCREQHREVLVSGELLSRMRLPAGAVAEALGRIAPRGKEQSLEVYSLSRRAAAGS